MSFDIHHFLLNIYGDQMSKMYLEESFVRYKNQYKKY